MTMHRLLKQYIKPIFLFAHIALLFLTKTVYSVEPYTFEKRALPIFDMTIFQANLGWTNLYAPDKIVDIVDPSESFTHTFKASGMHIAFNLTDFVRVPSAPTCLLGARIGAQIFSGLKDTFTIETSSKLEQINQINQAYSLWSPGGFFGDVIAFKTFQEKKLYTSAFAGVEYDRYRFQGFEHLLSGVTSQFLNDSLWAAGARVGAGFGVQLKGNFLIGIEYTHRFKQSIHAEANATNYPASYRSHMFNMTGNSVDLIFSRALYDR
jgi:hypothetical protein